MAVPSWFEKDVYNNKLAQLGEGWDALGLIKAFQDAGFDPNNADSLFRHFQQFGNAEGVSPNSFFNDGQYLYAKAADYYGNANVTAQQAQSMLLAMNQVGMSPWQHYDQFWAENYASKGTFNNPSISFDVQKYMDDKLAKMQADDPNYTMDMLVKAFQDAGLNPIEHYMAFGQAEGLHPSAVGAGATGETYQLTSEDDEIYGTAANDYFNAKEGTLQSNDYIDGGAGNDTLYATINAGEDSVISPEITNVETILFRAQQAKDNTGNNLTKAYFDAENVHLADGQMLTIGSDNSRADLSIEDVRHNSTETTVRFSNTDPGGVDLKVYFDPQHLTSEGASTTGYLSLQMIDATDALTDNQPLAKSSYTGFSFMLNGVQHTVYFNEDHSVFTTTATGLDAYQELADAISKAIAADESLSALGLNVQLGDVFTKYDGNTGNTVKGQTITLSSSEGSLAGVGWTQDQMADPTNSMSASMANQSATTCPLIQTNVELDNVGRVQWDDASACLPDDSVYGSQAGELVIGSMSGRGGVERFDVVVDKGSWLSSLSSTNETLRMVTVKNGAVNGDNDNGNLFIGQSLLADESKDSSSGELLHWMNAPRLLSTDGLTDVKVFDASEMVGKVNIGAQLTENALAKYMADVDGLNTMYSNYAPSGDFRYYLGSNDDTLNMKVNAGIAADRDFKLDIQTNAGNDLVNFSFEGLTGNRLVNQIALNNVSIDLGAGNDELWFWGNGAVNVNDGDGADKVYVGQNIDQNAVFVFGANSAADTFIKAGPDGAQPLGNEVVSTNQPALTLTGATADSYVTVTVTFNGISSEVTLQLKDGQTVIDMDTANHAIIEAINNDPTLSALLVAKDGMGNSLLVESLVDGKFAAADLSVKFEGDATSHVTVGNGVYTATGTDSDLALGGAEALNSSLQVTTEGDTGTPEVQVLTAAVNFADGAATDTYTVVYNGDAFTFQRGADAAAMATAMQTVLDATHTGMTVTSAVNPDGTTSFTINGLPAGVNVSDDTVLVKGTPTTVTGSDTGTTSMNTVDLTLGNDVISLNVGSAHNAFDTLVLTGIHGDDTVLGFQSTIDKIDVSALVSGGNHSGVGAAVAGAGHGALTVAEALTTIQGMGFVANEEGVALLLNSTSGNAHTYTVFQVADTGNGTIDAGEVQILGTLTVGTDGAIVTGDLVTA
ncbi:MAG: hypothetical protein LUG19_13735 [Desulfovibrio sp.]|uniref:hypothetical protein n=1 Tax=Desulfovibrio sp. TaxID=885 RepID=UPI00258DDBA7|nr:hypothetical protein [Desulfovibrio sp.]MCD7985287.1 hypothetical protein [Desulfovibrio sp.]